MKDLSIIDLPEKYNLVVVAHPDDETLFMGGLLLAQKDLPWHVICVTDANADGQGQMRAQQFAKACEKLKVQSFEQLDFPDIYEKRLDVVRLAKFLEQLPSPVKVYTHGIVGEYGHPHHQDVSWAVHQVFGQQSEVMSVAYNSFPSEVVTLSQEQHLKKAMILNEIYGSETQRFSHLIPNTFVEGFTKVSVNEVEAIYSFVNGREFSEDAIQVYSSYWTHFNNWYKQTPERLF